MLVGKGLQFAVVGGHDGKHLFVVQVLDHGHGQGRPFGGIGPYAHFVHQHQVPFPDFIQNGDHVLHMAGEGGQALFNALFIPDIRIDPAEHRQDGFFGRDEHPCLGHEGEHPHGL